MSIIFYRNFKMKIQKAIFSTSEEYSDFWNLQSKIMKEVFDIDSVCILYGNIKNTDMSDKYGQIIQRQFSENLPKVLQITWSKFFHPSIEPDTTWLVGDIDMFFLQKKWITKFIEDIDDDYYLHMNCEGCGSKRWSDGGDLPAHYHIAKGSSFTNIYNRMNSLEREIEFIVNQQKYGLGFNLWKNNHSLSETQLYWCAEENYSSELIRDKIKNHGLQFKGFSYLDYANGSGHRIDRASFNGDYAYDISRLRNNEYVDIHCMRPFKEYENQLMKILKEAKMI